MLADLGADVVRSSRRKATSRASGAANRGLSGYYTQQNVGKRNISIDLRAKGGPELVAKLADHADVLVENFRPGVMDKLAVVRGARGA